ncbi:Holliday junction resolvase RuvX [Sulfurospirillum deleyianum]|uniref:Putative pre-16S rRNA nuclease n=1 Tax=Sulfurospirillum deleyianum (strain ATCC 51133 / DSM 6946 / 5175) TaxID=525898 RepID=D1B1D4_SULD5|nr:Holliday junction resolvase RuvX [Sulfurospirillum deleyianum]ACZ11904.1 Holliday junction resolvase YqgF [Sulfurospirillum deleyianum DSM 6946]
MKKIASLDVGLKRIGVALCLASGIVTPQEAILRKNRDQAAREVDAFLTEWEIELLVVGLPKGGSSEEEMKRRITHFVSLLAFSGEVVYQDEYGSSLEAKEMMQGIMRQKRDGKIDSIAAKVILERYLDTQKASYG